MLKCWNAEMLKCWNAKMLKCYNAEKLKWFCRAFFWILMVEWHNFSHFKHEKKLGHFVFHMIEEISSTLVRIFSLFYQYISMIHSILLVVVSSENFEQFEVQNCVSTLYLLFTEININPNFKTSGWKLTFLSGYFVIFVFFSIYQSKLTTKMKKVFKNIQI